MGAEFRRETADEKISANLRALREQRGISQSELARQMSERGHPWHQSTVARVQQGTQQLRAAELMDLAEILHTSVDRFTWTQPEAGETEMTYAAGTRVVRAARDVTDAVTHLLAALDAARRAAGAAERSKYPRVQEARRDTISRLEANGLDDAVDEGIRRYEERFGDGEDAGGGAQSAEAGESG